MSWVLLPAGSAGFDRLTDSPLTWVSEYRRYCLVFLTSDFSRKSGDKSSPPAIAPLAVSPTDSNEEKVDPGLHGNLSSLTLEGEEEKRKVHHPEASEDTSSGALSQDSQDSKPLQGVSLGVESPHLSFRLECVDVLGKEHRTLVWGRAIVLYSFLHKSCPLVPVCHIVSSCESPVVNGCSWLGGTVDLVLPVELTLRRSVFKSLEWAGEMTQQARGPVR